MPLPESYLPRKGDELLIRVVVKHRWDDESAVYVSPVDAPHSSFSIPIDKVHSLHCRCWTEGDKVREISDHEVFGDVVAISDDDVWVKLKFPYSRMATINANRLELYDPDAAVVETMTEAELLAGLEGLTPPCDGRVGSQSIVGDDDPISTRDEAANR